MAVRRATEDQSFAELGLPAVLTDGLARLGITEPRPIQAATLPDALAGRDVLGRGRTGSGKTYAFVLPVLARLAATSGQRVARRPGRPRALILAPTRELAAQIEASIAPLGTALGLRTLTVFGGVGASPQIRGLAAGVDVLVACPGRLLDHVKEGHARLDAVEITVLDEADHMADLGFLPSVRRLLDLTPRDGQRMLFSATLDAGVDVLVRRYLDSPVTHSVDSALSPVSAMSHHVLHIDRDDRLGVLVDLTAAPGRSLVFTRTKYGAKSLARRLVKAGVPAVELHGNLGQNARKRNLQAFTDGTATTMVATDIAARGIHVDDVELVIHADPPVEHKAYLHRSGRTARGDAGGTVVTLMTDEQTGEVRDLTRRAGISPTTNRVRPGDQLLVRLAPGERAFVAPAPEQEQEPVRSAGGGNGRAKQPTGNRSAGRRSGAGGARRDSDGRPSTGNRSANVGGSAGRGRSADGAAGGGSANDGRTSTGGRAANAGRAGQGAGRAAGQGAGAGRAAANGGRAGQGAGRAGQGGGAATGGRPANGGKRATGGMSAGGARPASGGRPTTGGGAGSGGRRTAAGPRRAASR